MLRSAGVASHGLALFTQLSQELCHLCALCRLHKAWQLPHLHKTCSFSSIVSVRSEPILSPAPPFSLPPIASHDSFISPLQLNVSLPLSLLPLPRYTRLSFPPL